ncbi:MAG: hypothetical protein ACOX0W_08495 [Sphaerochaetaceae bacterium]|jgi:hypothetical protein
MKELKKQFKALAPDATEKQIADTIEDLNRYNYDPIFILEAPNFLSWKKKEMIDEYHRLASLPKDDPELAQVNIDSPEEAVKKQMSLLLYHYDLLVRLRVGESEAWDVVYELYEDD